MSSWLHCEVDAAFLRFLFFLLPPLELLKPSSPLAVLLLKEGAPLETDEVVD